MAASSRFGPDWLHDKLAAGTRIIMDGAMGTELEARGVPMDSKVWSGAALLTHPDIVRSVHAEYIEAGAEVIITNTFAAGRHMLEPAGFGEHTANINQHAVELARQAREEVAESPVAIAGSMCEWTSSNGDWTQPGRLSESYQEQAGLLADAGVDLIVLEMCSHPVNSALLAKAAVSTGLPVWLGLSCRQSPDGDRLVGFDSPRTDFDALLKQLSPCGAVVVNIMHSAVADTMAGLQAVRQHWSGPIGAYPESGHFAMPNWQFVDIIEPDDLVMEMRSWVDFGAQIIGGCCGLGVSHIRALKSAFG